MDMLCENFKNDKEGNDDASEEENEKDGNKKEGSKKEESKKEGRKSRDADKTFRNETEGALSGNGTGEPSSLMVNVKHFYKTD